jgi:hypothetical protein
MNLPRTVAGVSTGLAKYSKQYAVRHNVLLESMTLFGQ